MVARQLPLPLGLAGELTRFILTLFIKHPKSVNGAGFTLWIEM